MAKIKIFLVHDFSTKTGLRIRITLVRIRIRHPGNKDNIRLVFFLYRTVKTTGVFRTLNFELYAKPNKFVMVFGVLAISG